MESTSIEASFCDADKVDWGKDCCRWRLRWAGEAGTGSLSSRERFGDRPSRLLLERNRSRMLGDVLVAIDEGAVLFAVPTEEDDNCVDGDDSRDCDSGGEAGNGISNGSGGVRIIIGLDADVASGSGSGSGSGNVEVEADGVADTLEVE